MAAVTTVEALQYAAQQFQARNFAEAEGVCRQVLRMEPENADALHLLGVLAHQAGHHVDAMGLIGRAIVLNPGVGEYHAHHASAAFASENYDEAISSYRRAFRFRPSSAILNNLGAALRNRQMWPEAIEAFRNAIHVDENNVQAHWNLSRALLATGDLVAGFEEFEWRLKLPGANLDRGFSKPQWDGTPLNGRTLLLHAEGGFGDALQFIRYVSQLKTGSPALLECQPELVSLFKQVSGIRQIISRGAALPAFDVHLPLQGLARIFKTTLETIPAQTGYLAPETEKATQWRERLKNVGGIRVGLVWAGSPNPQDFRTRTPDIFAPLTKMRGVAFFSLQKGPENALPIPDGMHLGKVGDDLADFSDAAAAVSALDLIITVDTSMAHLAGALGKPVWVLIPLKADFRWLLDRDDSPWYPTMRLFRQKTSGDWNAPIMQMVESLRKFAAPASLP